MTTLAYPLSFIKSKTSGSPSALRSLNRGIEIYESAYYCGIMNEGNEATSKSWYGKSPLEEGLQIYDGTKGLVNALR